MEYLVSGGIVSKYHLGCLQPTLKYGGRSVLFWSCFLASEIETLHRLNEIMNLNVFTDVVLNVGMTCATALVGQENVCQMHNDPNQTVKGNEAIACRPMCRSPWLASQSLDLKPIERVWDI